MRQAEELRLRRHDVPLATGTTRSRTLVRLESLIRKHLDGTWTDAAVEADSSLNEAEEDHGRTWDRTTDLPRVKRALSR
jgi:hypothetical protein